MCIRDSFFGDVPAGFDAPRAGLNFFLPREDRNVILARSLSCLLYTSDAADERSSVDLGGRRIIKKKKQ